MTTNADDKLMMAGLDIPVKNFHLCNLLFGKSLIQITPSLILIDALNIKIP